MTLSFNSREVSTLPSPACTRPPRLSSGAVTPISLLRRVQRLSHLSGVTQLVENRARVPTCHQPSIRAPPCQPDSASHSLWRASQGLRLEPRSLKTLQQSHSFPAAPLQACVLNPGGALPSRDSQWLSPVRALWISNKVSK